MKVYKTLLISISLLYFTTVCILSPQNAFSYYFEDDFSLGLSKWEAVRGNIEEWDTSDGMAGVNASDIKELVPMDSYWQNPLLDNYIYEVDMLPLSGVDRNISFRFQDLNKWNEIHHTNDSHGWYRIYLERVFPNMQIPPLTSAQILENGNESLQNGVGYHFRIVVSGVRTQVYLTLPGENEKMLIDYTDANSPLIGGKIGLKAGSAYVKFDNVRVSLLDEPLSTVLPTELPTHTTTPTIIPTVEPTVTPTISPTITPTTVPTTTPTSTPFVMTVPLFKQYSLPWKNSNYDHLNGTIEKYGCALTSAAMILKYYGHNADPDKLNSWLKDQSDGYIRNGLVNWLAVTRYTKQNDKLTSPTLEYKSLEPTIENLNSELNNKRPAILKEDGHFVVATGINGSTYNINDPGYKDRNTLESYSNNFLGINTFKPTHSDLSYMLFVINPDKDLKIFNSQGNEQEILTRIENPIKSILNPNKKSGDTVKLVYFEKPKNGDYKLKVSGPKGKYTLDSYMYETNGNVSVKSISNHLNGNDVDVYSINYKNINKHEDNHRKDLDFRFWLKEFWKFFNNHR